MELTDPNGLGDSDLEHRIVFRFPLASVLRACGHRTNVDSCGAHWGTHLENFNNR